MTKITQPPSDKHRVTALETHVRDLQRQRRPDRFAMRDLTDASLVPVLDGQVPTYDWNSGLWVPKTPQTFRRSRGIRRRRGSSQQIYNAALTIIGMEYNAYNYSGIASHPVTGITVPATGLYTMSAGLTWNATSNAGIRWIEIYLANTGVAGGDGPIVRAVGPPASDGSCIQNVSCEWYLGPPQEVQLRVYQNSGADIFTYVDDRTGGWPYLSILMVDHQLEAYP